MSEITPVGGLANPFTRLRALTTARVGLGRSGEGLPTAPMLAFQRDHALARDAVHAVFEPERIAASLAPWPILRVNSQAADRGVYLRRPDLGRRLDPASAATLEAGKGDAAKGGAGDWDLAIVIADGLSAPAVHAHAVSVAVGLMARLAGWRLAPVVLASMARVALGDEIGMRLGAGMVLVLIGERPGLSAVDSLGAYLTWAPAPGRLDSERNCVSNIRPPHGLSCQAAADTLAWLARAARAGRISGVGLKDGSGHGAPRISTPSDPPVLAQPER